jgi:hypothetical protein
MKKALLFFVIFILFSGLIKAQTNKEEIDIMQAAFGMEKKAMVAEFVQVDDAQKDAFWKLYDEYETQRKVYGKQRIDLLNEYTDTYQKMTNESADAWLQKTLDLGKKTDALLLSYYKKVKKATNPINALQFYQVENFILTGIRNQIMGELPFVEVKK